jgi:hypothetical protein
MKFIYPFIFFVVLSCGALKKEYVCGDHPCIDKKEFNEYFSKNLIVEIKSKTSKKNKKIDLVKLNTESLVEKKIINTDSKKEKKMKLNQEKKELKIEKIKLLKEKKKEEENKTNKIIENVKSTNTLKSKKVEERKVNEVSNNRNEEKKIVKRTPLEKKKNLIKTTKKTITISTIDAKAIESLCDQVSDCDIDKITELLIKKGKGKPFPDL